MAVDLKTVTPPRFAWKALNDVIADLTEAIARNRPVEGTGIRLISHDKAGVEITISDSANAGPDGPTPWKITPDQETAGWHQINVIDQNCKTYSMWVWGGSRK